MQLAACQHRVLQQLLKMMMIKLAKMFRRTLWSSGWAVLTQQQQLHLVLTLQQPQAHQQRPKLA
jgi:hypothetical protein